MEDNSPTENGGDNTGSQSDLPVKDQNVAAESTPDTGSGVTTQDSGQPSTDNDGGSTADDDLADFAKGQGIEDFDNLSDRELRLLKIARDNTRNNRKKSQQDSEDLKKAAVSTQEVGDEELENLDPTQVELLKMRSELAQTKASERTNSFYIRNPDAREYDKEMGQILVEEMETNGRQAAAFLATNLDRLLVLAKARKGDLAPDAVSEAARREERELLRKRQEASGGNSHASNTHSSPNKVTKEWLSNGYDPSNVEHRKMVDEAISRGDLY